MLRLLIWLIFLIASIWFGLEVVRHPGYVLVVYQPWMIQLPLWFALLSLFVLLGVFYLLMSGFDAIRFSYYRLVNWLRFRRENKSYSNTQKGLSALIEGRWKQAESLLLAGITPQVAPLVNYLGAAKAAQSLGAFERRDQYLQKAYRLNPRDELAVGLTQAQLSMEEQQYEQAIATLNQLRQQSPRQPRMLSLLERAYTHLGDWQNLLTLLPSLRKANVLTAEQISLFEKNLYCELLRTGQYKSVEELRAAWYAIPRHLRAQPAVVCAYVKQLQAWPGTASEIEELIRKVLKYNYEPELVNIYGTLPFEQLNKQLVLAGTWLKSYGQQPALLLLLGKLCVRIQLWGKAKDYFEKCLAQGPNPEASLELGNLLETLGEMDAAVQRYREGLAQAAHITMSESS